MVMPAPIGRRLLWLAASFVLWGCAGCGLNAQSNYRRLQPAMLARNWPAANAYVASVKDSFYGKHNSLLYEMDRAMVLHLSGNFVQSNACLEEAKTTAQKLWTQSVSQNAAAWLTTDEAMPYQGEEFEKVMLHVLGALNYMSLQQLDDARVEARQVSSRLALHAAKTDEGPLAYRDDAFARWLSGLLFEADTHELGALSEAWIDYKRALQIYEEAYGPHYGTAVPPQLISDALRVLEALGAEFADEFRALRARYPQVPWAPVKATRNMGRIVLIHGSGEAPYKADAFWTVPVGYNILRIAYPVFVPKPYRAVAAQLNVRAGAASSARPISAMSSVAEDLSAIARRDLADHMDRIKARAIARAVAKFSAGAALQVVGAHEQGGQGALMQVAGLAFNTTNALMEHADKRSWLTLPAQIGMAEVFVPAGEVACDIAFIDPYGQIVEEAHVDSHVAAGGTLFVSTRTLR
jgi:hypothetical protein